MRLNTLSHLIIKNTGEILDKKIKEKSLGNKFEILGFI